MAAKTAKKTDSKEEKVKKVKFTGFAPLKLRDFTITQKNSGRYAVVNGKGKPVNGEEKIKILLEAKLLKPSLKKETATETPAT